MVSISEPAEDRAGVSVDWAVKHSIATLDDCLRRVGFTLQHWRLWRHTAYIIIVWRASSRRNYLCVAKSSPLIRTNESALMEPTLFSAMHT